MQTDPNNENAHPAPTPAPQAKAKAGPPPLGQADVKAARLQTAPL